SKRSWRWRVSRAVVRIIRHLLRRPRFVQYGLRSRRQVAQYGHSRQSWDKRGKRGTHLNAHESLGSCGSRCVPFCLPRFPMVVFGFRRQRGCISGRKSTLLAGLVKRGLIMRCALLAAVIALALLIGGPLNVAPQQPSGVFARAASPRGKKLYIIAPQIFHPALADFVRHKRQLLPVKLFALETVLKSLNGRDDPERLKRFLYQAWRSDRLGYALLVGDADVMPVRYMVLDRVTPAAFHYAFCPSDLYYSDLAKRNGRFEDWNGRKKGFHARYFGEVRGEKHKKGPINYDRIDYLPEIAVGRWPVHSPAEVKRVAAKSIAYENSIVGGRHPGLRRAAFFAVSGWVDSRNLMDRMAAGLPAGWRADKRYYAGGGRPGRTLPPNEEQLLRLLN